MGKKEYQNNSTTNSNIPENDDSNIDDLEEWPEQENSKIAESEVQMTQNWSYKSNSANNTPTWNEKDSEILIDNIFMNAYSDLSNIDSRLTNKYNQCSIKQKIRELKSMYTDSIRIPRPIKNLTSNKSKKLCTKDTIKK